MNTTSTPHDDNATTWRDLADQLTPRQVAAIERLENTMAAAGAPDARETLLEVARDEATRRLLAIQFADVPVPAGARGDGEGWCRDESGEWSRVVVWHDAGVDAVGVSVDGRQSSTGEVTPRIAVYVDGVASLTTGAQARELAAQLLEAADKLDELHQVGRQ